MRMLKLSIICLLFVLLSFNNLSAQSSVSKTDSPDVVSIMKGVFNHIFHRPKIISDPPPTYIKNIEFSKTEILNNDLHTDVFVDVDDPGDPETLLYKYQVSAGKIVGEGARVIWDLSGVKAGTYTITVEIDDGCGCLKPVTKEIKVVECCQVPPGFTVSSNPSSIASPSFPPPRRNQREIPPNSVPVIKSFNLSKTELTQSCSTESSVNDSISDISVDAEDADKDTLLYKYAVTAGRIIGSGSEVHWDLSGVKAGTYQVALEIDDGCGCVKPVTKEIKILDCSSKPPKAEKPQ